MAETSAARLGGFLRALVGIFKRPTAPAGAPKPSPELAPGSDRGLASAPALVGPRDIQARLISLGLLDPPADGVVGPLSRWALGEASRSVGAVFDGAPTPGVGDALARAQPLPLAPGANPRSGPGAGLAGRIVRAMLARGHSIARHPDCLNIVYVEGIDPDGRPNDNAPNRFNDLRCLIRIVDGIPTLAGVGGDDRAVPPLDRAADESARRCPHRLRPVKGVGCRHAS